MYIYIRSMSETQKEIRRTLSANGKQLLRHVIRLVLYPDCSSYNHWKQEIVAFVNDVDRVKGRNQWPKPKFIKDSLAVQNDMIDAVIDQVKHIESELEPRDVSNEVILHCVEEYQDWLSEELSANGIIYPTDAYRELDRIVSKTR